MNDGQFIFSQVAKYLPRYQFDKIVAKYKGDYRAHGFTCYNQFLHLLFGQLTACNSLRDICLCLAAHKTSLFHLGFRKTVDHTTLSRANERRDYRIYEELGQYMIGYVRPMYAKEKISGIAVTRVSEDQGDCSSIRADFFIKLIGAKSKRLYPEELRIIKAKDPESGELITFITNNFELPAIDLFSARDTHFQIEMPSAVSKASVWASPSVRKITDFE